MAHNLKIKAKRVGLFIGSIVVIFSFSMAGHSQLGGVITQALLMVHLFGITFWLGSLLPFRWICLQDDTTNLSGLAHQFGILAMGYVGLLLSAGFFYAYMLIGELSLIFTTSYGNLLLIKIILVCALLFLAALNKFKLVPSLEKSPLLGVKKFKSSVQLEIVLAFIIVFASSLLTTSITLPVGV